MARWAGGSKEKELTLDDVWEAKLVFVGGGGGGGDPAGVRVQGWTCWQSAAGSEWHESSGESDDDADGGEA